MINASLVDSTTIVAFWLVFTRWLAIIIQLPIFDQISIPSMVKVLVALIISYAFFPHLSGEIIKDMNYVGENHFWVLTIFHSVVGLVIGFFVKSIMAIFHSAGSVITQQIGFDAIRYFDMQSGQEMGPLEKLIGWTVLVMVISSGALAPMFKGVYGSFFSIHFYDIGKLVHTPLFFLDYFKSIFVSALILASPLIFTNILITSVLGIVSRAVPQMNIIMVSFVINIGLGLFVFVATSSEFFQSAFGIYTAKLGEWFQFFS